MTRPDPQWKDAREELSAVIKRLIVEACDKEIDPQSIGDDEVLFGPAARLALDSLDALQVSMALQKRFGIRLVDSTETRRILATVASLADFLAASPVARR
jgi:acyl carrier protein